MGKINSNTELLICSRGPAIQHAVPLGISISVKGTTIFQLVRTQTQKSFFMLLFHSHFTFNSSSPFCLTPKGTQKQAILTFFHCYGKIEKFYPLPSSQYFHLLLGQCPSLFIGFLDYVLPSDNLFSTRQPEYYFKNINQIMLLSCLNSSQPVAFHYSRKKKKLNPLPCSTRSHVISPSLSFVLLT